MTRVKHTLCFLLPFAAVFSLKAQVKPVLPLKKVVVNTINYEQGLMNNETSSIITDDLGFTWIGTLSGLQRYNGYTLEPINPVIDNDTLKIRSQVYLYKLKNGSLWISTRFGILQYNPYTNIFKRLIAAQSPSDFFFTIVPVTETDKGIWCLKKGEGIVIYTSDGRLKQKVPSISTAILDNVIRNDFLLTNRIIAGNADQFFICTRPHSLLRVNTANHHFSEVAVAGDIMGVSCNKNFFYVSTNQGISKFPVTDSKPAGSFLFAGIFPEQVSQSLVYCIGDNRLLAAVNDKLFELDAGLSHPRQLSTFNGAPLLAAGRVDHIYRDSYKRIWVLTNDDIKRIQDREIAFSYLSYPGAANNFVRSLYFDDQSQVLLAGCFNGGLQAYDRSSAPLWRFPLQTGSVKDVLGITRLRADNYLIITWSKGWFLFDIRNRKLSPFKFTADVKWRNFLYHNAFPNNLQRINDSTLLIASSSNVFRCVFRGNLLISVKPILPFFKPEEDWINSFCQASDGTFWVGSYNGSLYRVDKSGKTAIVNLPGKFGIRCFAEDAQHHIWVGTSSGLHVFDTGGRLLKSFYKDSGLLNDCIYGLLPVPGKASVFASSNMGLSDISLNGNIKNYTKELGLQDNEFNTASVAASASGKFYFGGISGITAFYPSALNSFRDKPVLNVTRLTVNDSSYNSSGIWRGDTVRVKYNRNHLEFDFAAMGLLNADSYFYRYRMIGFGKNWQSTHRPAGISYILPPGKYTLQVACSDELSGPEVRTNIVVIIDPPFWLRWWFFAIMGFCTTAAVVLIVSFYNKRRYQKALQEVLVKQRLQNQREQISRDLHDNLGAQANAIFYGTELLMRKSGNKEALIGSLHDTARDMLTVLRETLWAMKITQVDAANLWLRILNFARKIGNYYPGLSIVINGSPPEALVINASLALNMILIVQEAINNSVRHSGAKVISVSSYPGNKTWRIEIIDDGKGFDLAETSKKPESYGLENMAERAAESNIAFGINSVPLHGTKVYMEIDISPTGPQLN
ncbi:MAG TPA: triple tyrosine motif-containing protein [Mucilaginibacter sp.]|nr:triple tyrosine motif-containing protein [Mucilaginibacter sp.]